MTGLFADNPDYREYERLIVALHDLNASGKDDSDEADSVRDRMDGPWRRLTAEQVERLNGLAADLYMLSDTPLTYIQVSGDTHYNSDGGDRYTGLDRFGRVIDQYWLKTNSSPNAVDRFQYGFDRAAVAPNPGCTHWR